MTQKKSKAGRKTKYGKLGGKGSSYKVYLPPKVHKHVKKRGSGKLSKGVITLAEEDIDRQKDEGGGK